jgi:hypothetical protein
MKTQNIILISLLCLFSTFEVEAQANIGYVYPSGGERGKSIDVVVGGQNLTDVKGVFVTGTGISGTIIEKMPVDIKAKNLRTKEQDIPQLEEMIKVRINIDKKAELGLHDFRLETENGYSNRIFFDVNELTEFNEIEPNDKPINATTISKLPSVVNGQIMPGERDCFRFSATKGQIIICQTKARALTPYLADAVPGWFQPVLTLKNASGKEVAYNDDFGNNPDPVIILTVPQTGDYTLEIKDAIYRGREDFVYRISIGEIPFVRSIFPLGGTKGKRTKVELDGVNLSKSTIKVKVPNKSENKMYFYVEGKGLHSNSIAFGSSDEDEINEEKNNGFSNPMFIPQNTIVNARIQNAGEEDWYRIDGEKGQSVVIELKAHRLGSLLDADITLYDEKNKVIIQTDDSQDKSEGLETFHADPQTIYKFKKDESVYIRVRDVMGKGGIAYGYQLLTSDPTPDFDLRINPSNLTINQAGTSSFTVFALRKYNFGGEIDLKLNGLPSKYSHSNSVIKKGQNQLRITITAPTDAKIGTLNLKISGKSENKNSQVERLAEPVEEKMQAFFYTHLLPTADFLTTVVAPLPFSISHSIPVDSVLFMEKETSFSFKVKVNRDGNFKLPIQIILDNPPKGIRMKPVTVPIGKTEALVTIETTKFTPNQFTEIVLSGVSRIQKTKKKQAQITKALAPAIMLEMPRANINGNKRKQ